MKDPLSMWNQRYASPDFAYGETPNVFLKDQIDKLNPGYILFPADGEGRNSVFAATKGWETTSFDISEEGKNKALSLAQKHQVEINYEVGSLPNLTFEKEQFDAMALIYAHFPPQLKSTYHNQLNTFIKQSGIVIFEAFSKNHLSYRAKNEKVGGPANVDVLFSIDEVRSDFSNYEILLLEETEVELHEGLYHQGIGSVVRFVGRKK